MSDRMTEERLREIEARMQQGLWSAHDEALLLAELRRERERVAGLEQSLRLVTDARNLNHERAERAEAELELLRQAEEDDLELPREE